MAGETLSVIAAVARSAEYGIKDDVELVGAGVALVDQGERAVRHLAARQLVIERVRVGGGEPVAVGEGFHVERQRLVDDAARDVRPRSRGGLPRAHGGDAAHGVAQVLDLPAGGIGEQRQVVSGVVGVAGGVGAGADVEYIVTTMEARSSLTVAIDFSDIA